MTPIRWGIFGTGKIAGRFAEALGLAEGAELHAVASRSSEKAEAFARPRSIPRAYGSYERLLADPEIDVVYVATPHVLHAENCLAAIDAGKAVLCEKPFTLNAEQAAAVVARARERRAFLMEAMWMRFIPLIRHFARMVGSGAIGETRLFAADFGFKADFPPEHRLYDPALGGGALLDLGVYPVHLANMLWGEPEAVAGQAQLGPTGVDEQGAIVLTYSEGRMATLYTSLRVDTPVEAVVMGEAGRIRLHRRMHHPDRLTRSTPEGDEVVSMPFAGNGLQFQAEEVVRCLRAGHLESGIMPLEDTLAVMRTLDRIRRAWGVRYPGEG